MDKHQKREMIREARKRIAEFPKTGQKKLMIDIAGLSHREVAKIIYGGIISRICIMLRYCIAVLLYPLSFSSVKIFVYRLMGVKIGRNVYIGPAVYVDVLNPRLITIGNNIMIGMGVTMVIHERTMKTLTIGRIEIKDNVTIGGATLVRAGITIENGAEIDALVNLNKNIRKHAKIINLNGKEISDETGFF